MTGVISETASAKINLALHVVGRREDGYHRLESLVAFASIGDRLMIAASDSDSFTLGGRFAAALSGADNLAGNLVLAARDRLRQATGSRGPVAIHLEKSLPVASGIGGGSADAAAALRGLNRLYQSGLSDAELSAIGLPLGADVPMCLASRSMVASGIGEDITLRPDLPGFGIVLVNPLRAVSTPAIFKALTNRNNPPLILPEAPASRADWLAALAAARNDLQETAVGLEPSIIDALDCLSATEPLLHRMSGSGATCFGLYADESAARLAAETIRKQAPDWFVEAGVTV